MPAHGDDHPSRRNTIVDAALDMADKLVKTQYEFIRSVVSNASETLKSRATQSHLQSRLLIESDADV
jgi:hypothetical protein